MSFFTILTATYNAAATLPRLLDSLAEQTCRDFELIIQDGASTDNTVAVAESYRDKLPDLSLASEPDTGIYDAWNKAIKRATGQWFLFLGGDDCLASNVVLQRVKDAIEPGEIFFSFVSTEIKIVNLRGEDLVHMKYVPGSQWRLASTMPAPFPGLFIQSKLCRKYPFDASFRISADKYFLYQTWQDVKVLPLPWVSVHMLSGGISSRSEMYALHRWEGVRIFWKSGTHSIRHRIKISIKPLVFYSIIKLFGHKKGLFYINKLRMIRGLAPYIFKDDN